MSAMLCHVVSRVGPPALTCRHAFPVVQMFVAISSPARVLRIRPVPFDTQVGDISIYFEVVFRTCS